MRLLGALAALAAALFGVIGAVALWTSSGALEKADHNTAQVVRVQGIYADLLRADADATNAFLVGGLEDPTRRANYDQALAQVAQNITAAATAQPADGAALGALNSQVQTYASTVEQARVYNRQGMPVGAQYLSNASAGLRANALPILDNLTKANSDRAAEEFGNAQNAVLVAVAGPMALAVLAFVMFWLARRSHRYVNLPLVVAAALVLAALVVGGVTLGSVGSRVSDVQDRQFADTLAVASARTSAFDAKANESLTLIARGSGSAYEKKWQTQSTNVLGNLGKVTTQDTEPLKSDWNAYVDAHKAIRTLDDGGNWDKAVAEASRTDASSANGRFDTFDQATASTLGVVSQDTSASLLEPRPWVTLAGWVLLVLCVAAALLALQGMNGRIEEYR